MAQWSIHEDEQLRKLVKEYGPKRWSVIASKLKTKGSKQCRRRWKNHLNAELKSGGWTAEEDLILMDGHRLYGNKWTEIAKMVGGRTDNAVKNRYAALCKRDAKVASRGGAVRGGRGSRKPRPSDSDGAVSDVEVEEDSDEDAKRTSSSSVSREASPVRRTRGARAADREAAKATPPPRTEQHSAPSPPPLKAAAETAMEEEPVGSTGVRSSVLGRRRQPCGGSPPLQPEPHAVGPGKRRAVLQGSGSASGAGLAPNATSGIGSEPSRPVISSPQTPLVKIPQMQHQPPQASLITVFQQQQQQQQQRQVSEHVGQGGRFGSNAGFGRLATIDFLTDQAQPAQVALLPQPQLSLEQHDMEAMRRSSSSGREAEATTTCTASGQPKKLPLTINIPNAASADPSAAQPPSSTATVYGIEIRVLKDLLTPCEIQYVRELNDMQLPLHINVDEEGPALGGRANGAPLLLQASSSEPPLTTSRQAAHNALTALFSPSSVAGGAAADFNDVLKWFQTGLTPRSSCGDDMTPRLMSRLGMTPCGLSGSRGGASFGEDAGMLGTGLTPRCLLDSGSPRVCHSSGMGLGGGGMGGFTPQPPPSELSVAKRARRQVAVAAAVAAAASEQQQTFQHRQLQVEICLPGMSGSAVDGGGGGSSCSTSAAAALGMMSPGGLELHAGHRQLLTKLIQTAAAVDVGGQGGSSGGVVGAPGDADGGRLRFSPPSPSACMVTPEPQSGRGGRLLSRNLSGGGTGVGHSTAAAAAASDGAGPSCEAVGAGGVVVLPYFTQQELMLLLEVLNSDDLQALPPPPPPSSVHQ